jgi:hypothetical protein
MQTRLTARRLPMTFWLSQTTSPWSPAFLADWVEAGAAAAVAAVTQAVAQIIDTETRRIIAELPTILE